MRSHLLFLFLTCASCITQAEEFYGKVITVMDGDTVLISKGGGQPIKVRLVGIDAPEREQEYGMASGKSLRDLVLRKQVKVSSKGTDDYGRLLAEISVDGLNVNQEQVRRGMAWNYSRFRNNHELAALQREAQQARRGLWASESAIEPSQWRKQHPSASPTVVADPALRPGSGQALRPGSGQACIKNRCAEMTSCEEAKYYLAHCHVKTMDGDNDGIPCEKLCVAKK